MNKVTQQAKYKNYIPSSQYDVLLSDVGHNDLVENISQRLNVTYLSRGKISDLKSVDGILYGTTNGKLGSFQ